MPRHLHSNWPIFAPWGGRLLLLSLGLHGLMLSVAVPDLYSPQKHPEIAPVPAPPMASISLVRPAPSVRNLETQRIKSSPQSFPTVTSQAAPQAKRPAPPTALPSAVRPGPKAPEPANAPSPEGFTYNHQPQVPTADLQQLIAWYAQQDWSQSELAPLPGSENLPPLVVQYDRDQCLTPPPGQGRLEIIVNSDGTLLRAPRLLASTGYDALDRLGVEQAGRQGFSQAANPKSPNPTLYWLPLQVAYDGRHCPAPAPLQKSRK